MRPLEGTELEDKVSQLRIVAYPAFPEVQEIDYYAAIYRWYETHPLAGEIRRWVAATEEGEVVGHLAAFPQSYRIDGQRVVAHTPGDYMVLPQHGFQAIMLMRSFFRATENCVVCDMVPAVIGVETRFGAKVAGELQYAAKLMNVSRLPMPPIPAPLRRLFGLPDQFAPARGFTERPGAETEEVEERVAPPAPRPRAPIPGPLKGLLNRGLRAVDEALARRFGGDLEAEVLEGFDDSFDDLFERIAAIVPCLPEKDAAFLGWRYGPGSPQAPVTVLGVKSGGRLLGYAVLKSASKGQDGYVLDLMALPGRRDVVLALLRETVRQFRRMGVQIIRYRFLESPSSPRQADLRSLGFFYRKGRRNYLLVKFADGDLHETAEDIVNWSYIIGDGEASFWLR
ncbi:MAG: GNAT family N-acetyltransferase [Actinomycetota bacterium]|nr:GNAT family N-acetyltransferase [Actinomycetota bacterium]